MIPRLVIIIIVFLVLNNKQNEEIEPMLDEPIETQDNVEEIKPMLDEPIET